MLNQSQVVMAVFAHPDDAELSCFGTLAKLSFHGAKIHLLDLTSGESSTTARPGLRDREAQLAADLIEAERISGKLPDGRVAYDNETVGLIEQHLRRTAPDVVITHYPQGLGQGHQDHYAVSCATLNAARRMPFVNWLLYAEPQTQNSDFIPNFFIDISDFIELKKQAIGMYRSEGSKAFMHDELIESRARWWAMQASLSEFNKGRFYEAFSVVKGVVSQPFLNEAQGDKQYSLPNRQNWANALQAAPEPESSFSFFRPYLPPLSQSDAQSGAQPLEQPVEPKNPTEENQGNG